MSDAIRYAIAQTYGYEYVERKVGPPRTRYEVTIASALPKRDVVALLDSMDENVRLKSWSRASAADMVVVSVKNLDTGESTSKTQPGPDGRDRRPVVTLAGKIRRLIRKKIK